MKGPFVYKDTNILINKLDLKNQELLDQFESTMFQLSFMKILEEGFVDLVILIAQINVWNTFGVVFAKDVDENYK